MNSDLSIQITAEIEQYKEKYGRKWGMHFFDNFDHNLVGGAIRSFPNNKKGREMYKNWRELKADDYTKSEKMKSLTHGEFYDEIDTLCKEIGIDEKDIIEKRKRVFSDDDWSIFDLMIPVYIQLRERGYTQRDLWVPIVHS